MIQARLSNGTFILGVDAENIRRLTAGLPIVVDFAKLGGRDRFMMVYGETYDAIVKELEESSGHKLPPAKPTPPGAAEQS